MIRNYLEEILDGNKNNDVRTFPTKVRGKIALVESESSSVVGFAELIEVLEITEEEYCRWHASGIYKDCVFRVQVKGKKYYSYKLEHVERIGCKVKVKRNGRVWIDVDETIFRWN